MNKTDTLKLIQDLTRKLTESGLLVEAGFAGMRIMAIAPDASPAQIDAMRTAFFCGAHHVFTAMMNTVDGGDKPSDGDMARMKALHEELENFMDGFAKRHQIKRQTVQ